LEGLGVPTWRDLHLLKKRGTRYRFAEIKAVICPWWAVEQTEILRVIIHPKSWEVDPEVALRGD
jgi:hypothetical protein